MHAGFVGMLLSARDLHLSATDVYAHHCMANLFMCLTLATCFVRALVVAATTCSVCFSESGGFLQHSAVLPDAGVVFCFVLDVDALPLLVILNNAPLGVVQVSSVLYSSAMSDKVKRSGKQWCHV